MNKPSIAGVSHTTRKWSPNAVAEPTDSQSMRQRQLIPLPSPARPSMPVPSALQAQRALDFQPTLPRSRRLVVGDVLDVARRSPRPATGTRSPPGNWSCRRRSARPAPRRHHAPTGSPSDNCGNASSDRR